MTEVAIVYHSGFGHTKLLAEAIRDGAASVAGVEVVLRDADDAIANMESLSTADAIIFGAPTYMGSASAKMSEFIDATSKPWSKRLWRDKIAGGFTNSGSLFGDKDGALRQFYVLAMQHGMVWIGATAPNQMQDPNYEGSFEDAINRIGIYSGAVSRSENAAPSENNPAKGDIETAKLYGVRLAEATKRWCK